MELSNYSPTLVLVIVVALALAPFLAVMVTSFTKIVVVLSLLRNALGLQQVPPNVVMILIIAIYLVAGCFMDSLAMVTLTVPILYPTVQALGFDPIWFGVIIVVVVEMGVITPPVGINVYIIKGVAPDVPMGKIFRGASLFLAGMVILAALLILFPILATWLPSFVTY